MSEAPDATAGRPEAKRRECQLCGHAWEVTGSSPDTVCPVCEFGDFPLLRERYA